MTRYGLKQTLFAALGAIALVTLAIGAVILVALTELREATAARATAVRISGHLESLLIAALNQETGIRGYLVTWKQATLQSYREGAAEEEAAFATLKSELSGTRALAGLEAAQDDARAWQRAVAEAAIAAGNDPAKRAEIVEVEQSGAGKHLFDRLRGRLELLRADENQQIAGFDQAFHHADGLMGLAVLVGPGVVLLFCAGVALALSRVVFQPILDLASAMRRLAANDLQAHIPHVAHRTEVGEMARTVQAFRDGLIENERTSVLRVLADTVPALIGYIDARRHVRFLNRGFADWFVLPSTEITQLYDKPLEEVFRTIPLPGYPDQLDAALNGHPSRADHKFTLNGTARDIEVVYEPHRNGEEILGAVTLITDVTSRKDYDRRLASKARDLKRSNAELEQFAYVASHDLKAPLRGIENLITWIEEDIGEHLQGDTKNNMSLLHNRVHRLESLLDDLLEYSRAGRRDQTFETIDSGALVKELTVLLSPPPGFTISVDDPLPSIQAPRAAVTQIFQNLLGNAIKHHDDPAHGQVHVSSRRLPDGTEFQVVDNGPGIPERFHERVFGMFQTLRPRDEIEGSGMGLAIVKKLVEAHYGSVFLEVREGRGTAVHFVWPDGWRGERE